MGKAQKKLYTATEFKEKCLRLIDDVDDEGFIITKRGHPVARLVPIKKTDNLRQLYGALGKDVILDDQLLSSGIKWNAES